jgi:hypothetical protein
MVTWVPAAPLVGETLVIMGAITVKFVEFDQTPPCRIWAVPEADPEAMLATTCVSLQLKTEP